MYGCHVGLGQHHLSMLQHDVAHHSTKRTHNLIRHATRNQPLDYDVFALSVERYAYDGVCVKYVLHVVTKHVCLFHVLEYPCII